MGGFHPSIQAAETLSSSTIGSQVHDLQHFLTTKANPLGKSIQRMSMADAIIAVKKGTEGKVFANQTLPGLYLYGRSPQKVLAMHEVNALARNMPSIARNKLFPFVGNKLNVNKVHSNLSWANKADNSLATIQAGTPVVMGAHGFNKAKKEGKTNQQATKAAITGAAAGLGVSAALYFPRKFVGGAAALHRNLAADHHYGYGLLEEASESAAKSMNRPKLLNYSHYMYKTPEENAKGWGRHVTNTVQGALGIKRAKGFNVASGDYEYDHAPTSIADKIRNKVDAPMRAMGVK